MKTKREIIDEFREMLKERNADTEYTNKFLYNVLFSHAKWLIRREISAGRIFQNTKFFQTIECMEVVESPTIPECCGIKNNCKIYRTKDKLPEMWINDNGPVIRFIRSIDNSSDFFLTTDFAWLNKKDDPYQKMVSTKYTFYDNGYLWFPDKNPHKVNINIFAVDDLRLWDRKCTDCDKDKKCLRFLDTEFLIPDWIEAEMFAKALQQLFPVEQLQSDNQQDKNPTRKN